MTHPFSLIGFGIFVGIFSGLMGLGGGAVIIPVLVLLFEFSQQAAHGTSLAMILSPTALPGIVKYHQSGAIDWKLVLWVAPGMLMGSYVGAYVATSIPQTALKLIFGFVLIYVAGYTVFGLSGREHLGRTLMFSLVLVLVAGMMFGGLRFLDAQRAAPAPAPAQEKAHGSGSVG